MGALQLLRNPGGAPTAAAILGLPGAGRGGRARAWRGGGRGAGRVGRADESPPWASPGAHGARATLFFAAVCGIDECDNQTWSGAKCCECPVSGVREPGFLNVTFRLVSGAARKSRYFGACAPGPGPIVINVMKGSQNIIDLLNDVLSGELTAVNQYWMHARMCQNWGYERLWNKIRAESIDEMKHADQLVARILYLEGMPNLQRLGKIQVGENVKEQFELDLGVEVAALQRLREGIALCVTEADHATRELLEHILVSEEEHVDWLETQLTLVNQIGLELYLSQQIRE
jgi:bacterioferritin